MGVVYPRTLLRQEGAFEMDAKDARNAGQNGLSRGVKGFAVFRLRCTDEGRQDMRRATLTRAVRRAPSAQAPRQRGRN